MKAIALFLIGSLSFGAAAMAQALFEPPAGGMSGGASAGAETRAEAGGGDGLAVWRRAFDAPAEPGLISARLLPGWELTNGNRMVALELRLQPGWKTYWRSPGDTGVPPEFDWTGSDNLGTVAVHWPRPEMIESGGEITLGYHELLVLPIEVTPADPDAPLTLRGSVDFGLCLDICVPGHATLEAGTAQPDPDPRIQAALDRVPDPSDLPLTCRIEEIPDGMRVSATVDQPQERTGETAVAMELDDANVWVSQPETRRDGGHLTAASDFIDETGKPFALDPDRLRITLISGDDAQEITGCDSVSQGAAKNF
ncbi:protein-disulfide reductase DsbD family protein [Paracoccus sp. DMF-8]|uniref:protein-disulfide reductase DsbD domain-containing protein n=1 Tax=Paracoccus sp. DMF-8 TaxID=3019445 RepID=UPI0023E78C55|nr:protein-disulfide reductase DsbD domain-containing protein [Paracoccus sp. DMF-8]MDF3607022.1 protein-disulfide reductase DsbD family protein [Paracoccus sp. DMF-8]